MGDYNRQLIEIQNTLFTYAKVLTGDLNDAQDLLQDTSLHILLKVDRYNEKGKFRSWAMVLMKNVFRNGFRNNNKETTGINGYEYMTEDTNNQLCETECRYYGREIIDIIDQMPYDEATILKLRILGYKYHEIAQYLSQPLGTVRSNLFSAKIDLLNNLKDYDIN